MSWNWIGNWRDRFQDLKRHFLITTKSPTPQRWFNFLVNLACAKAQTLIVPGYPYVAVTDPINVCNFKCPLCPTGLGWQGRPKQRMSWKLYRKALNELGKWIFRIWFFNWGEPLLHPRLFDMIKLANRLGIATNMSTNGQLLTREKIEALIQAELDYLIVSIDGYDQDSFGKYRKNGNFETVLGNLKNLVSARNRHPGHSMKIEWQSLVFSHNQDDLERIQNLGEEVGVDRVRFMPIELADSPWTGRPPESDSIWFPKPGTAYRYDFDPKKPLSPNPCFWLYETVTINSDGGVAPCCRTFFPEDDFGNFNHEPIRKIFNNLKYQKARALFREGTFPPGPKIVCQKCREYTQVYSIKKL